MGHLAELRWMLPPLAMCLVLTGIHGYLGLHVLSRKVIFVDLALAQIAALGSVCAVLLGYDPKADATTVYFFSLGFTFVGAAVFALTRMRHEKVPQEAFIGILYATASAVALLLLAQSPGESEHIKEMLVGNVLLVTWGHIAKVAALYAAIGAFHFIFREPFLEISTDAEAARARGRNVQLWDFLFYASFGLVITSSVAIAGVLLVFTFLVVPGAIAFMFSESLGARILFAWSVGCACSAAGILLSYFGDLPTGPSVVACFAAVLGLAAITYYLLHAERRRAAGVRVLVGIAVVAVVLFGGSLLRKGPAAKTDASDVEALAAMLSSADEGEQLEAIDALAKVKDPRAVEVLVGALEKQPSDRVAEHILEALPEIGAEAAGAADAASALQSLAGQSDDAFVKLEVARALLRLRDPSGFAVIGQVLDDEPPLMVEEKAGELLGAMAGEDFGIGKAESDEDREAARQRFATWLKDKGASATWHPDLSRFD